MQASERVRNAIAMGRDERLTRLGKEQRERENQMRHLKELAATEVEKNTEKCIREAERVARQGKEREVRITLNSSDQPWKRDCYLDAATKVIQNISGGALSARIESRDFRGHLNSSEIMEEYFFIDIIVSW